MIWKNTTRKNVVGWIGFGEGERNTKFFHPKALRRQKKNLIISMETNDGCWEVGDEKVFKIIEDYFSSIFFSLVFDPITVSNLVDGMTLSIPLDKRLDLECPFSRDDV